MVKRRDRMKRRVVGGNIALRLKLGGIRAKFFPFALGVDVADQPRSVPEPRLRKPL